MKRTNHGLAIAFGASICAHGLMPLHGQAPLFVPGCTVPFTAAAHDIDNKCAREGDPTGSAEGKLQDTFKTKSIVEANARSAIREA